jgi:hypothetical protein
MRTEGYLSMLRILGVVAAGAAIVMLMILLFGES